MDEAFDNYFALSKLLTSDVELLLQDNTDSQSFRRNFVRAAAALTEGYLHCFRDMCQVGLDSGKGPLSEKEFRVLQEERSFDSISRVKLTHV